MNQTENQASEALQRFIEEVHSLCLRHMSAIRAEHAAREKQRLIADLRDNLSYRLVSVRWHYNYLCQLHRQLDGQFLPALAAEGESTSFLLRAAHQTSFVFDDIIFNLVSCFDYIARLVGFLMLGDKAAGLKWNGLVNSARDSGNRLLSGEFAELVVRWNRDLVNPLQKYRGDLIHRERMMGNIEGSVQFGKDTMSASVVVSVPDALAKVLTGKASFRSSETPDVLSGAGVLIERAVGCGTELVRATK